MGILNRIKNIFTSNANKALDKIEDPILLLEQKVRELKDSQAKATNGLAKVKAEEIKLRKDAEKYKAESSNYAEMADKLKERFATTSEDEKEQAKADIITILNKVENMNDLAEEKENAANQQGKLVASLESKIKEMTKTIKETEANISNMKARKETAAVSKEVSKELSDANFDGIDALKEKIETQITADEAEANAWDKMDSSLESDEERIKRSLEQSSKTEDSKLFDDFMKS